jgi:predicted lipoprotein
MTPRRALLATALLLPGLAWAQPGPDAQRDAIRRIVAGHVLPRHAAFTAAARDFAIATAAVEANPSAATADAARAAWVRTALAFQGIRHLRFGPMDAFDRGFRIDFFPDTRNTITRDIAELLRGADPASLTPEAFARGRVGGQGLPAAERLLFGADAPRLLAADQAFRRTLLTAIGRNLLEMANGLEAAWVTQNPAEGVLLEGSPGGIYQSPQDGLLVLFKSLHGGIEFVAEREVARPLGPSLREAFPRRAEAWRSEQSLALVAAAIVALEELWRVGFAPLANAAKPGLAGGIDTAFTTATTAAAQVTPSLEAAVANAEGRSKVEALVQALNDTRHMLADRVAPAIGVPVGFNSTDGD